MYENNYEVITAYLFPVYKLRKRNGDEDNTSIYDI